MTLQEEKELLLKDVCARLPYGVKGINQYGKIIRLDHPTDYSPYMSIKNAILKHGWRPYLFPLSSMTEEQYDEMEKMVLNDYMDHMRITNELREKVDFITHWPLYSPDVIDWFNRNHFDYRGLIEMGLALKAPDGMYKQNI